MHVGLDRRQLLDWRLLPLLMPPPQLVALGSVEIRWSVRFPLSSLQIGLYQLIDVLACSLKRGATVRLKESVPLTIHHFLATSSVLGAAISGAFDISLVIL